MKTDLTLSSSDLNILKGKLTEVEAKNLILLSELEKMNSTISQDKEVQRNTIKGLERLGDSLASMKVDMMNKDGDDSIKTIETKLASINVKQLSQEQEITRTTGRLNKVELDINKMNVDLNNIQQLAPKTNVDSKLREEVNNLGETLTTTRNTLAEVLTKMDFLESQGLAGSRDNNNDEDVTSLVNTLKTNVIGLGTTSTRSTEKSTVSLAEPEIVLRMSVS